MYMYRFLFLLALLVNTSMIKPWQCKDLRLECWPTKNRPSLPSLQPGTFGQCAIWGGINCQICAHELERAKAVCKAKGFDHGGVGFLINDRKAGPHLHIKTRW
jgi:hypothetical protein